MDDEAETYKLWRIRKTIMQVFWHFGPAHHNHIFFQQNGIYSTHNSLVMTVDIW